MRVDDLIKKLKDFRETHGNINIGFTGHYGEFYPLSYYSVDIFSVDLDERMRPMKKETIVRFPDPGIGPEVEY